MVPEPLQSFLPSIPGIITCLLIGALLLWLGAEWLVKGASVLAQNMGLPPLLIGITVVAFGTSAPEWIVSMSAQLRGNPDSAIGNIVGSNICNLSLVLGITALLLPVRFNPSIFKRELPLVIAAELFFLVLALGDGFSRSDGLLLLLFFIVLYSYLIRVNLKAGSLHPELRAANEREAPKRGRSVLLLLLGLTGLSLGAQAFVVGSANLGSRMGLSDEEVGVLLLAFGTSLPELLTCVVAAWRGHMDLSIGNLLGSNFFNVLFVGGSVAIISPLGVPHIQIIFHIPWMIGLGLLIYPLCLLGRNRHTIGHKGGAILVACQLAWVVGMFLLRP